jgi:23S rRNA (guanosine2251-2'-O)-methyltransferase
LSGSEWVVGYHAVVAALSREAARLELVLIAAGTGGSRARHVIELARAAGIRFDTVPRQKLAEIADRVAHNGFAARLAPTPFADPNELLAASGPACVLGLDGVEDGHNLGAIVRVAAAFDLSGIVVAGPHPPPLGGAAAKVAAGTLPLVAIAHVGSLGDFARRAKDAGYWVFGAVAGGDDVRALEIPERVLLCLGAEAGGLRAKTARAMDGTIGIPLSVGVESLNLAVAAGILAWEWRRRIPLRAVKG